MTPLNSETNFVLNFDFVGFICPAEFYFELLLVVLSPTVPPNNLLMSSTVLVLGGGTSFSFCGFLSILMGVVLSLSSYVAFLMSALATMCPADQKKPKQNTPTSPALVKGGRRQAYGPLLPPKHDLVSYIFIIFSVVFLLLS